ncbi:ATP-binding protein [Shewanella psychrotolerans]|uniref:ATP-binding protein n=1 Tax=Shewanella psychrotolerans TaxID=2864206 RepID=UPI001C66236D|nr:ATP-binding protein [Shewanella psychrotolerans]QYK00676.1 ATP-binding protein [Shewanella psychrotolerans]
MTTIKFPKTFDRDTLQDFFDELDNSQDLDKVCVDCSTITWSKPTAMLVAGSKLRQWIQKRRELKLSTTRKGVDTYSAVHDYLKHIGFFDFVMMGEGKCVGEAKGSSTYTAITRIAKPIMGDGEDALEKWYESIQSEVRGLAIVISGEAEGQQINKFYNYALREIVRNVFEHSGANECYVFGQRWCDGKAEIVIVDEGVGISSSLTQSYELHSDIEALKLSVKPGVSRTSQLSQDENVFDNSGFGLYVLTEIARSFGWYALGSNTARIVGFNDTICEENMNFSGTYFGLRLVSPPKNFSELTADIIKTGEDEAQEYGIERKASGITKIL